MQSNHAPAISPSEWRWAIIFSGILVAVTLLPYGWAFASNTPVVSWQFMGILPNPTDNATYLAKIGEGARGDWLFTLPYTPETGAQNSGAAINEFYLLLGHLSRLTGLSWLLMFHVSRLVTGFAMYLSLYHLGSTIWSRLRPRRLFFALLAVGSGLGWLYIVFAGRISGGVSAPDLPTDLWVPESIPFYSTYVNPHFPLAIALIALLAATFVMVFRPGFDAQPTVTNGGLGLVLITAALSAVQPQALIPIMTALVVYLVVLTVRTRRIPLLELNWVILVILPALPFLIYYQAIVRDNEAMRIWNSQNQTASPSPFFYFLGFGLILIVALPGIWRGIRRFERDGDRFMVIWLGVNVVLLYTLNIQRRFSIGLIIPLTYFAVRALEDYWFHRILPPWRDAALVAVFVFIIPSNILALGIPIFGVAHPDDGIKQAQVLYASQGAAIRWLSANAAPGQVILAPANVSLWIPAYTAQRVVYGHPFETLNAEQKRIEVALWFLGADCSIANKYNARYVVSDYSTDGPPTSPCFKMLGQPVASFNGTYIYAVQ